MMKEKRIFQPVSSKDVCLTYELLLKRKFISFPLTDEGRAKADAIVANITAHYFGEEIYKSNEEKAIAYLYFLIKDHPFTDGNKRTASLVFEIVCELNELRPHYENYTLDVLAVYIEKVQEKNHQNVIRLLSEIIFQETGAL